MEMGGERRQRLVAEQLGAQNPNDAAEPAKRQREIGRFPVTGLETEFQHLVHDFAHHGNGFFIGDIVFLRAVDEIGHIWRVGGLQMMAAVFVIHPCGAVRPLGQAVYLKFRRAKHGSNG